MSIRISNLSIQRQLIDDITRNQKAVQDLQLKLSTGLDINRPSDNPVGVIQSLKLKTSLAEGKQHQINVNDGISRMGATVSVLSNVDSLLLEIIGVTSDAVNNSSSADIGVVAQEIDGLINEIYLNANAKFLGKYIFGGAETTTQPYSEILQSGNTVGIERTAVINSVENFKGIDDKVYYKVSEGLEYQVNISGSAPFVPNGEGGANDIFSTLITLRDQINNNDVTGAKATLKEVNNCYDNVITQTTILGSRLNRLKSIKSNNDQLSLSKEENLSEVLNVDQVKAITDLNYQQYLLQASLQVGKNMISPSLLDYI